MVGICGVIGEVEYGVGALADYLTVDDAERTTTYREAGLEVLLTTHPQFHAAQPATAADGTRVWIYGTVYGCDTPAGYRSRPAGRPASRFCADRYDQRGPAVVGDLNGEFIAVFYDPATERVQVSTDRIGSIPLFVTSTDSAVLFASRLQALGLHPAVRPAFDRAALAEFFAIQKAFGEATILRGVSQLPPATTLGVSLEGAIDGQRVYWRPRYRPVKRSPTAHAERLAETFDTVIEDRLSAALSYGVMLSGGTDSRLLLSSAGDHARSLTAYHLTNWASSEATSAARAATAAGVDYHELRRGRAYHADLLDSVPAFTNFVGTFDEYIASGFAADLAEVDVLLTGYLGDTLFGRLPLYLRGSLLPFSLPVERRVDTVDAYLDRYLDRYDPPAAVPDFLDAPPIRAVVRDRVRSAGDRVVHHGVEYATVRDLQLCEYYPLTNQYAYANSDSLRQITGHTSPFFDPRLIELHLQIPVGQRVRRDLVAMALTERSERLAAIPHGTTGVPPAKSVRHGPSLLGRKVLERVRHRFSGEPPPEPYLDHSPWMDEAELIRTQAFLERAIDRNGSVIDALPVLDGEQIEQCYREHLAGANHWRALYALVTLLESPVARRIARAR